MPQIQDPPTNSVRESAQLLRAGVAAARAGDTADARELLLQATDCEPGNETAWLWRAGVAEPHDAIPLLERVLQMNPGSDRARAGLKAVRFQAGVAEAQAGNRTAGQDYFAAVVADDPAHELALLWLACLAGTPEESLDYFNRVLAVNPEHGRARQLRDEQLHRQGETDAALTKRPNKGRVLIVDDNPTERIAAGQALERDGYAVLAAGTGPEAMDRIAESGVPDLVFLDVALPGMDGYEVCSVFRQSSAMRAVPIVLLTGKVRFLDKIRGRFAGSAAHLGKPFTADQIVAVARTHCSPHR